MATSRDDISLGRKSAGTLTADPDKGEFWCPECKSRCTQSPTKPDIEYGHQAWCPDRPDSFPNTSSHSGRAPPEEYRDGDD